MCRFRVFRDRAGQYRWRLWAANGRIVAVSGEGYRFRAQAWRAAHHVRNSAGYATVEMASSVTVRPGAQKRRTYD